jgi:hypothetical protein
VMLLTNLNCSLQVSHEKTLFFWIMEEVTAKNNYFKQKCNVVGQIGFSALHKCVVAMKMLAYGGSTNSLDDHLKIGGNTVLETMKEIDEIEHILQHNKARGFSGMIGSIDCMHWEWYTCPTGWASMYKGYKGKPTMILEVVTIRDLRI